MKRLLKNLTAGLMLATLTGAASQLAAAPVPTPGTDDTIVVKLNNDAVMTLVVKNVKDLENFKAHSLDSLMLMLSTYVSKVESIEKTEDGKKVQEKTVYFYPSKDNKGSDAPDEIKITVTEGPKKSFIEVSSGNSKTDVIDIGRVVKVNVEYDDDEKITKITTGTVSTDSTKIEEKKKPSRWDRSFNIDLGFNAFTNSDLSSDYDLDTWGSRYVALGSVHTVRIGGEKSPFGLRSGIEFAFNNYMFETSKILVDQDNETKFVEDTDRNIHKIDKQKLATTTVNVPLMAMLQFKDSKGKESFRLGAGGFAGYRIGAHTKLKYENESGRENKEKDPGNFNLEDLQYGLNATLGFRSIDFFAKYNMNSLFKDNRGPDTNVISFGISL